MGGCRIVGRSLGLRIDHPVPSRIEIDLEPWGFVVSVGSQPRSRYGLFQVEALAAQVREEIVRPGSARRAGRALAGEADPVARLISRAAYELRERDLPRLNPLVCSVVRAVWRASRQQIEATLLGDEHLYRKPFVVADVLKHRAAAIALGHIESELRPATGEIAVPGGAHPPAHGPIQRLAGEDLVDAMVHWRGLFSPTGASYRSLDRTLMQLPAELRADLVCELRKLRLERPVTDGLVLTALLSRVAARRPGADPEIEQSHYRALQHASHNQLLRALQRIGEHEPRFVATKQTLVFSDLCRAMSFLAESPVAEDDLGRLVRAAIQRHDGPTARTDAVASITPGAATVRPKIPLPKDGRIRFLATEAEIIEEGERMGNCVASYAAKAVLGRCHLFHVTFDGAGATVELSPAGFVRQAWGPDNVYNRAAAFGEKRLGLWGKALGPWTGEVDLEDS